MNGEERRERERAVQASREDYCCNAYLGRRKESGFPGRSLNECFGIEGSRGISTDDCCVVKRRGGESEAGDGKRLIRDGRRATTF